MGTTRAEAYVLNATGARTRSVNAAILTVNAGDIVTVETAGASDVWAGSISGINFSGYLIG
jgi:hypothetical protein